MSLITSIVCIFVSAFNSNFVKSNSCFLINNLMIFNLRKMWSPVVRPPDIPEDKVPVSRSKHATVLHGQCLYLLGGRNGNLPMKDFWKYCIGKVFLYYSAELFSDVII